MQLSHDPDELPPEMSTPAWMARAIGEMGQAAIEGPGSNPRIDEYLRACTEESLAGGDETAWCAAFMAWVMSRSGYPIADEGQSPKSRFLLASAWLGWGMPAEGRYGAIAVIISKGRQVAENGTGAHVGFLVRESGNDFILLGGNQEGGRVSSTRFPKASYDLLGYRWPTTAMDSGAIAAVGDTADATAALWLPLTEKQTVLEDPVYPLLSRGSPDRGAVMRLQRGLRDKNFTIDLDGLFGPQTEKALITFQRNNGLQATGSADPATWAMLDAPAGGTTSVSSTRLTDNDINAAANMLDVTPEAIRALIRVESAGSGFVKGMPKILFEGHVFWRELTKLKTDPSKASPEYSNVLYEKWTTRFYRKGEGEYDRLAQAVQCAKSLGLDDSLANDAAKASASWGLFQILGTNHKACGFDSATAFAKKMLCGESAHLDAFCQFVISNPSMHDALKARRWADFARAYNGPAYAKNRYDQKLAEAYVNIT